MVKKILIVLTCLIGLNACSTIWPTYAPVEKQYIPLLYCPAPTPVERPSLSIQTITRQTSAGEIAKLYKMTIVELKGYCEELERIIEQYDDTHASYDQLREQFKKQWEETIKETKSE